MNKKIVVIGGGAAGFFGAIAVAGSSSFQVILLEKTQKLLSKVRISGGGRCNVTHSCFEPVQLISHYPRGKQLLKNAFFKFQPKDTIEWFSKRNVLLKTEADGRIFPTSDNSETIVSCLVEEARKNGVEIRTGCGVDKIERGFLVHTTSGNLEADCILLATGSNPTGHKLAESLGHTIAPLAPSLFTFHISDPRLEGLSGISVPNIEASIVGTDLVQRGPVLVTHWGLSGPAILKLSAWGARILQEKEYKGTLCIRWVMEKEDEVRKALYDAKQTKGSKLLYSENLFSLPKSLSRQLLKAAHIPESRLFAQLSKKELHDLTMQLLSSKFTIVGKSLNKEEFVTCGGISLEEINFQTMESKICPGLFFAGEILDVDGITGGFNFQNAWTTSYLAAQAIKTALS